MDAEEVPAAGLGAWLVAAGCPAVRVALTHVDTVGEGAADHPIVALRLSVAGSAVTVRATVARSQTPHPGDEVFVVRNPEDGLFVYVGPAPRPRLLAP